MSTAILDKAATVQDRARELIDAYGAQSAGMSFFEVSPDCCAAGRQLLAAPPEIQMWAVVASLSDLTGLASPLRSALLRRRLPFTADAIAAIIDALLAKRHLHQIDVNIAGLIRALESFAAEHGVSASLRERLERLGNHLGAADGAEYRKAAERVARLLETGGASVSMIRWRTDEAWVENLRAALDGLEGEARGKWLALLLHCNSATSSKPSQKWLTQAGALIDAIGKEQFAQIATGILEQIGKPARTPPRRMTGMGDQTDATLIHDVHSDILRGLIWCTSLVGGDTLTRTVGAAADSCFQKIPWIGPRAPKIGNACLFALSQQTELKAVSELSHLKTRVKHASVKKQLDKSLDRAADRAGMSAEEIEEIAVPTFGLTGVGAMVKTLGDVTVRLEIGPDNKTNVTWHAAGKKPQASVPASIKDAHAAEIKGVKTAAKEIDKLLPAQRIRLERLFLAQASWSLVDFRQRYLDHPLVGTLARRLIWRFEDGARKLDGIWHDGALVRANDQPLEGLGDGTRVTLWHPSGARVDEVVAWRTWLEAHQVRQPFKQAHREIYVLTDAERATGLYSNRFAAHILRQHQFAALCRERGWTHRLFGNFDSGATPSLELPRWDLRVEFSVAAVETSMSSMMIFLYLSTDQLRFYRAGGLMPLPLVEVPPLVFSEVLRDVDLFVGVASVGNDPNWRAGGPAGRYRTYWNEFAFGDLSASAQTRRDVLERLLPTLKIAGRCSFSGRFLLVKGDLHTYKIHLGSGNVLMSPNDQYLCIVPDHIRTTASDRRVFLPFEGDEMLSIILSKAFLLAADAAITDATILRQMDGAANG